MKRKNKNAQPENNTDTNKKIDTFEDLVSSDYCMMYFARGCRSKRYARGLCDKHYHMVRRCVLTGSLKWERVESQLKALPPVKKESFASMMEELSVK